MSGNPIWNERLKALETLLAELYPTVPDSRRVVVKAALPVGLIRFHDTAAVNWFNILEAARNYGRVDDIVRAALSDFPEHAGLISLAEPEIAGLQNVPNPPSPESSAQKERRIKPEVPQEPAEPRPASAAAEDDGRHDSVSAKKPLVVLVHGIRTRAAWYIEVRDLLLAEGFEVALTNYGRFDLFRFLFPFPFIKAWAAADVERYIRAAMVHHQATEISVIAHSFGTYVTAWILKRRFDIKFKHIIFCGSVVKFRFPFEQLDGRFASVLNEVGTRDIWPVLAVSATWGYGSAGAFGFNRSPVHDRYHKGLSHSAFLNAQFCETWWIPVLRGERPKKADLPEKPPLWLQILSVVHVKYVVAALLAFWGASTWCRAPEREVVIPADQTVFAGHTIDDLVAQAEKPCAGWCPEFLKCQRCMRSTSIDNATRQLVLCRPAAVHFRYRDPSAALERLRGAISCVQVEGVSEQRLKVQLNKTLASEIKAADGRSLWLCGCDEEGKRKVLEIVNR
jgi:pimeloyl-ACP methyl ester carboxylesterase